MREISKLRDIKHESNVKIEWKHLLFKWNSDICKLENAVTLGKKAEIDLLYFVPTYFPDRGLCIKSLIALEKRESLYGKYIYIADYGFEGYRKKGYSKWIP